MTTPDSKEAPERIWLCTDAGAGETSWAASNDFLDEYDDVAEYVRADLVNREPSEGDFYRMAEAFCKSISEGERLEISFERTEFLRASKAALSAWRNP